MAGGNRPQNMTRMTTGPVALYLAQHGESKSEQEDAARPLTDRGRFEVGRVAQAARRSGVEVLAIHHSGKLRAQQTAEIFAEALSPKGGVSHMNGLAPNDDPTTTARVLEAVELPTMLVGHLPHLSRLASLLVAGDPAREVVAFRMGGLVCLDRSTEGRWRVRWALTPEVTG